ncbi:ABC1 kinase family protein [Nocardia cyriacigeorgica]|uniref:ABC1 kinase family protein n=1 Tax=Nocardia cyriacigeorgica TaxID=135487 RepID=UPI002017B3F7|nr:AarF/ABC1/UbiB kinase family protein [Nocardia cyriacigeorgica]
MGNGVSPFPRRSDRNPPTRRLTRNATLASLPVAFAGRRAAGIGKRAMGRSADEVERDIQLRTAEHIFEVLGELRGCATKLGQLLSVYEMALPSGVAEPYQIALRQLQDSTPAMLPAAVDRVMAASMGPDWRWYFKEFSDRSSASASIGQVHRAVWRDGREVAVKIMYPGARDAVRGDLRQVRRIAFLATVFVPGADVNAVLDALSACIEVELDYATEAGYQRAFAAAYADDPDFVVPQVIEQRGDVIVSEWIEGVPLARLVTSGARAGRDRAGHLVMRFLLSSWSRSGLLYGDPHPGNFLVLPDGRLGVVDFGACQPWPPPEFTELIADYFEAIFNGGPAALDEAAHRVGFVSPDQPLDVGPSPICSSHCASRCATRNFARPETGCAAWSGRR